MKKNENQEINLNQKVELISSGTTETKQLERFIASPNLSLIKLFFISIIKLVCASLLYIILFAVALSGMLFPLFSVSNKLPSYLVFSIFLTGSTVFWILIVVIFVKLVLRSIFKSRKELKRLKLILEQAEKTREFGNMVNLSGNKGTGKTTGGSGFIHLMSASFDSDFKREIAQLKLEYYWINFNKLDIEIYKYYEKLSGLLIGGQTFDLLITERLTPHYASFKSLSRYVYCLLRLIRGQYIYSNINHYNSLTKTRSLDFGAEDMCIKKPSVQEKYAFFDDHYVIFHDDKLLDNFNLFHMEDRKNDDGRIVWARLLRHLGRGTAYYLSTAQSFDDITAKDRKLYDTNIETLGFKLRLESPFKYIFYGTLFNFWNSIITLKLFIMTFSFRRSKDWYIYSKKDVVKKRKTRADILFDRPYAFSILKRKCAKALKKQEKILMTSITRYYYRAYNVDSEGELTLKEDFYLDYLYCWTIGGCVNSYEFQSGHHALRACSGASPDTIMTTEEANRAGILIDRMLTPKVSKTETRGDTAPIEI